MSMAASECVSVSSQADTERADLERRSLAENTALERQELARICRRRGLTAELAEQGAIQLMAHDALGAGLQGSVAWS
jgi:VIT1/CCC1 family predicted Fe2+/Mn2+ transporter